MASTLRPALPLARSQGVRLRVSLTRVAVVLLLTVALAGLVYALARTTSVFAVRTVEVTGASAPIEQQIEAALAPYRGRSLVGLDLAAVERSVEAIPAVRSVSVDRGFPRTLHVAVRTEDPIAVIRRSGDAWLVAASGKVLERVDVGTREQLPRIWLPRESAGIKPSEILTGESGGWAAAALAAVPSGFPARVLSARSTSDELTLILSGSTELRLGAAVDVRVKLAVAATVLRSLSLEDRGGLAYLDVSLPARPVGASKPQVEA